MKKIIAFSVCILFLFFAVKTVLWTERFLREAVLESSGGRTNILILGVGGGGHEGSDLTDTIIVLSLDTGKKTVALISVPRDTWSDTLKDKVNSAYHYGNEKSLSSGRQGGGLLLSKVTMEDVIGMPIQYAVVVDFSGFTKVIDAVGGIDVNVPEAFTDSRYPKPGMEQATCPGDPTNACVYETVHFDAGVQHMDGARALIYARSRHAEGDQEPPPADYHGCPQRPVYASGGLADAFAGTGIAETAGRRYGYGYDYCPGGQHREDVCVGRSGPD